jgi:hypothetical protein
MKQKVLISFINFLETKLKKNLSFLTFEKSKGLFEEETPTQVVEPAQFSTLTNTSDHSNSPLLQEKLEDLPELTPNTQETNKETESQSSTQSEIQPTEITEPKNPRSDFVPFSTPKINIENVPATKDRISNRLKFITEGKPKIERTGSLGQPTDFEGEILERRSAEIPRSIDSERPKLSVNADIDERPSLDFSKRPKMDQPLPFAKQRRAPRQKLDLPPLMGLLSSKPKVIHVRKRSWNEDNHAFNHFVKHDVELQSDEELERKSFSGVREKTKFPDERPSLDFNRKPKSKVHRDSFTEDMPPLEDQDDVEASETIGRRMESLEYHRIKKEYHTRFRFDPRIYFFLHLAWILGVGFFGGIIIYLIELSYTQISFVDAIFMAYSAVTVTGLFAVNFGLWSIYGQITIFCCICKMI